MKATLEELSAGSFRGDRFCQIKKWLRTVEKQLHQLETENRLLRNELAQLQKTKSRPQPSIHFVPVEGALWKKSGAHYDPIPFCPRCQQQLILFPSKIPDVIRCPACRFQPPFAPVDLKSIRKLLPR